MVTSIRTAKKITNAQVQFYKLLTKKGGMSIDIGAHTGDTTVPMALAIGKKGIVLGLEPNPYVFKILEKNSQLNKQHTNIVPLCFAATDREGIYVFNYSGASFCNGSFLSQIEFKNHHHNFKLTVKGKNLQDYLFKNYSEYLEQLDLIKIDAEGYDKEILKTIPLILKDIKPNLIIECYVRLQPLEREELYDFLFDFEYQLYLLGSFEKLENLKPIERQDMLKIKHFDILAIHKSKLEKYSFL